MGRGSPSPLPRPLPPLFLGLHPRFRLRPQFSGASRPRLRLRPQLSIGDLGLTPKVNSWIRQWRGVSRVVFGAIHILRHHRGGGGVTSLMTTDDKGVVGHDDVIKKKSQRLNRQYTRVPLKPRILHYHQSCCSVIILICIYYCIIHGLFQFHAFCRQTFIDISD